jgi:hypothetical protein
MHDETELLRQGGMVDVNLQRIARLVHWFNCWHWPRRCS